MEESFEHRTDHLARQWGTVGMLMVNIVGGRPPLGYCA